ncbi:MAG: 30S ribosomal protein S17 [Elusimicrobia bacterium]|nr:30S ribosomal protein S17 [Candidatus Liberimonas magnetica]
MENSIERNDRKTLTGTVIKDKMNKTRVVEVSRTFRHSEYAKVSRRVKSFCMHDEKNETHIGDKVIMMETRPLSKTKRWRLLEIVGKTK